MRAVQDVHGCGPDLAEVSGGGDDPRAEAGHQVQLHPGQLGADGVVGAAHLQRHATSLHRFGQERTVDLPCRQSQHFSGLSSRRLVSRMTARPNLDPDLDSDLDPDPEGQITY